MCSFCATIVSPHATAFFSPSVCYLSNKQLAPPQDHTIELVLLCQAGQKIETAGIAFCIAKLRTNLKMISLDDLRTICDFDFSAPVIFTSVLCKP